MEIRNTFEVPLPPDEAWKVLLDIPGITDCVPGAELTEEVDDKTYKGRITVKLGPIKLLFNGTARFEEIDDSAHSAVVKAQGSDAKGRGAANATVRFGLSPSQQGSTVDVATDVALSGMVAQYGRGAGIIQGLATQLVDEFSTALRAKLAKSADGDSRPTPTEADHTAPTKEAAEPRAAKPISGFRLVLKALWNAISGAFGKK